MRATVVKVSDVCDQIRGVSYSGEDAVPKAQDGYLAVLRANNITEEGLTFDDLTFVPAARISEKQLVRSGDVVIAASSGSLSVVGKAAPALTDLPMGFGAFCKVLRPNQKVAPAYFSHYFKTRDYRQKISSLAAGANINNLRNEHLGDLRFPLPPLEEQRRIAAILDQAETLRTQRRQALANLDTLTQSLFLDMFGDSRKNPKLWPTAGVESVCELIVDCVNRTAPIVDEPTPYKMIRTTNVKAGKVHLSSVRYVTEDTFKVWNRRATPVAGDVILTREAPLGEAGILDTEDSVFLGQRLMLYRPAKKHLVSEYLLHSFLSPFLQDQFERHGSGSTVKHLPLPACRAFELRMPSLSLQQTFATRIQAIEALKATHRTAQAQLDALFASLQQRAFAGEL